ncbi:MAG: protein kinase [Deltaproteobacteria bacterium]|nr:protein kinase [Deltaproteobacteria bacterium]
MSMIISRKYEVLGQLGQGGMGVVYKVRHMALDSISALKMLPRDLMENPDMVARFYREARVVARLSHPNIVRVSDIDHDEALGFHYFVMEYIEGQTFAQYLRERGPLPLHEVVSVTRQAASALAYAHSYTPSVIHRDIKPANIMIEERTGRVVVMDFGIAKELDTAETTQTGMVIGTLKYCSPEQMLHEQLDGRADIYSLGMVMYEAYAGSQFFAGLDETAVIGKVLYNDQDHLPVFSRPASPAFVALVTKAIAKSRDHRYQNMEELLQDLNTCEETGPVDATERIVLPPATHFSSGGQTKDEVKDLEEQIRKLEEERQRRLVSALQAKVHEARERAAQAGAARWASVLFQEGLSWEEGGNSRLRAQEYLRTQEAYHEAERVFAQAYEQASAAALLHRAEQARQEMATVKTEADQYGAREKARTFYGRGLSLQAQADELWESKTYQQAEQIYLEARGTFTDARDLAYRESVREEAVTAQAEVSEAREVALKENADIFAQVPFQLAEQHARQAASALQHDEFFQARESFAAARQQYLLAQQQAHAARQQQHAPEAERARQQMEAVRARIKPQDERDFATLFSQAHLLEEQGRKSEERGEYLEAAAFYERARQEYEHLGVDIESARSTLREQNAAKQTQPILVPDRADLTQASRGARVPAQAAPPTPPPSAPPLVTPAPATARPFPLVPVLVGAGLLLVVGGAYLLKSGSTSPPSQVAQVAQGEAPASSTRPTEPARRPQEAPPSTTAAAAPPPEAATSAPASPPAEVATAPAVVPQVEERGGETASSSGPRRIAKYTDTPAVQMEIAVAPGLRASFRDQPVAVSPDGKVQLALNDVPVGESLHTLRLAGGTPAQSQDIAVAVHYYPRWEVRQFVDPQDEAYAVAFAPDGRSVVSSSKDKVVKLWDVTSGEKLRTFSGHTDWVSSVAFSPDGQKIMSCSDDKTVRLWEVATGKSLRSVSGHSEIVNSVAFAPDGKLAVFGGNDKALTLWDVQTGKEVRTLKGHTGWVLAVAFSPDGKYVASGSEDSKVKLWDVKTGKTVRTLTGHKETVFSVAFSPDGQTLVSGSHDNTVRLWDVQTGQAGHILLGHEDWVNGVAFSPDGQSVASGSKDKTVRLWSVASGQVVRTFVGHAGTVAGVAFSPDGTMVISGSRDKTLRLWWAAADLVAEAPTPQTSAPAEMSQQ